MHHYELVFLVHPEQSDQVPTMIDKYQSVVKKKQGKVHRVEDWGRRSLAYHINRAHKAHYILMNVESDSEAIDELRDAFEYNDAVLRHLITRVRTAETQPSIMMQKVRNERKREAERNTKPADTKPADAKPADMKPADAKPADANNVTPSTDTASLDESDTEKA